MLSSNDRTANYSCKNSVISLATVADGRSFVLREGHVGRRGAGGNAEREGGRQSGLVSLVPFASKAVRTIFLKTSEAYLRKPMKKSGGK